MSYPQGPQIGAFFKINRWNTNSIEQLRTELLKAMAEDPQITDATNIGLELETATNKVERIELVGSVKSEPERQRAARIVEVNTHEEVVVENELAVG